MDKSKTTEQLLKTNFVSHQIASFSNILSTFPLYLFGLELLCFWPYLFYNAWTGARTSPATYSCFFTNLHVADVCTWLDFVISVIVLINQSQLAVRGKKKKNWRWENKDRGEGRQSQERRRPLVQRRFDSVLFLFWIMAEELTVPETNSAALRCCKQWVINQTASRLSSSALIIVLP